MSDYEYDYAEEERKRREAEEADTGGSSGPVSPFAAPEGFTPDASFDNGAKSENIDSSVTGEGNFGVGADSPSFSGLMGEVGRAMGKMGGGGGDTGMSGMSNTLQAQPRPVEPTQAATPGGAPLQIGAGGAVTQPAAAMAPMPVNPAQQAQQSAMQAPPIVQGDMTGGVGGALPQGMPGVPGQQSSLGQVPGGVNPADVQAQLAANLQQPQQYAPIGQVAGVTTSDVNPPAITGAPREVTTGQIPTVTAGGPGTASGAVAEVSQGTGTPAQNVVRNMTDEHSAIMRDWKSSEEDYIKVAYESKDPVIKKEALKQASVIAGIRDKVPETIQKLQTDPDAASKALRQDKPEGNLLRAIGLSMLGMEKLATAEFEKLGIGTTLVETSMNGKPVLIKQASDGRIVSAVYATPQDGDKSVAGKKIDEKDMVKLAQQNGDPRFKMGEDKYQITNKEGKSEVIARGTYKGNTVYLNETTGESYSKAPEGMEKFGEKGVQSKAVEGANQVRQELYKARVDYQTKFPDRALPAHLTDSAIENSVQNSYRGAMSLGGPGVGGTSTGAPSIGNSGTMSDDEYLKQMRGREGGNYNQGAHGPGTTASGAYGLTDAAYQTVQQNDKSFSNIKKSDLTPEQQDRAALVIRNVNSRVLESNGLPVTSGTQSVAHLLGPQGAVEFLKNGTLRPDAAAANGGEQRLRADVMARLNGTRASDNVSGGVNPLTNLVDSIGRGDKPYETIKDDPTAQAMLNQKYPNYSPSVYENKKLQSQELIQLTAKDNQKFSDELSADRKTARATVGTIDRIQNVIENKPELWGKLTASASWNAYINALPENQQAAKTKLFNDLEIQPKDRAIVDQVINDYKTLEVAAVTGSGLSASQTNSEKEGQRIVGQIGSMENKAQAAAATLTWVKAKTDYSDAKQDAWTTASQSNPNLTRGQFERQFDAPGGRGDQIFTDANKKMAEIIGGKKKEQPAASEFKVLRNNGFTLKGVQ